MSSTSPQATVCRVYLLDTLYHIDKLYDYFIPQPLRGSLKVGGFVVVPFGRVTRRFIALVSELSQTSSYESELKPVLGVIHPNLVLTEEQMGLCMFLKEHTFCTVGDAVRAMLPSAAFTELMQTYEVIPEKRSQWEHLNTRMLTLCTYISHARTASISRLVQRFGESVKEDLGKLVEEGLLREVSSGREPEEKTVVCYSLAIPKEDAGQLLQSGRLKGQKQLALLRLLLSLDEISSAELRTHRISASTCESLVRHGLLRREETAAWRDPFADLPTEPSVLSAPPLNEEQTQAMETVRELLNSGQPKAVLLHGVTGSGKTRVMKEVIDEIIARGKSAILLVPEISLTPQTVGYFRAYYGERTAVLHSMLSAGERYDAWMRMKRGEIDLCIGTRSAVFAPLPNLGAILIDEEQEHTYKSDSTPKYHAIDVARFRCAHHGALMLLASATPSFESYFKAKQGIYTLITLRGRFGNAALPRVLLADQRVDAENGRLSPIGSELRARIQGVLDRSEQAILFVNRRGYHNFLSCPLCGQVITCPCCSVSLTLHMSHSFGNAGRNDPAQLRCHYCGHTEPVPQVCPSCGKPGLRHVGYGTQKAEEELHECFPSARIMRMDADTTAGKGAYREILDRFRAGNADILLGTQMVTKGHDFPRVTLVGVLNADGALYLDDFRATERTFSLLTQVVGRAGRGELAGEALIQTSSPHHPLFSLVQSQDFAAFYEQEIALRRALSFPPFCDLISLTVSGREETEVLRIAAAIDADRKRLLTEKFPDVTLQSFGPMEAPVYRVNEIFRMRLIVKCRLNAKTRQFFSVLLTEASRKYGRTISIALDPNPDSI